MPTLDWLNRDEAFRIAQRVPTRVLRPHPVRTQVGDEASGNLRVQDGRRPHIDPTDRRRTGLSRPVLPRSRPERRPFARPEQNRTDLARRDP